MFRTLPTLIAGLAACIASAGPDLSADERENAPRTTLGDPEPSITQHKSLAQLLPDEKQPDLWIGSDAPGLTLSHFVRGEPIASFEPGQTYVVEMWATWCGPCLAAFPHVAALQEKYGAQVRVIGVNIWEGTEGETRVEQIEAFVAEHPEMAYTVAIEQGTSMADSWMKPSGRDGIPTAFIVDGTGKVMWMGHPLAMDAPLDQIIHGGYDVEGAMAKKWRGHLTGIAYDQMLIAEHEQQTQRLFEVCKTLVYDAYHGSALPLNTIAWKLLAYDHATTGMLELAYNAAHRACELTDWQDWMILDTYALAAQRNGKTDEAIKWQTKAVGLAPEDARAEMAARLESFHGED